MIADGGSILVLVMNNPDEVPEIAIMLNDYYGESAYAN